MVKKDYTRTVFVTLTIASEQVANKEPDGRQSGFLSVAGKSYLSASYRPQPLQGILLRKNAPTTRAEFVLKDD